MANTAPWPCLFTQSQSLTHIHSLSLVLVVMKAKDFNTKIYSHADSLILSLPYIWILQIMMKRTPDFQFFTTANFERTYTTGKCSTSTTCNANTAECGTTSSSTSCRAHMIDDWCSCIEYKTLYVQVTRCYMHIQSLVLHRVQIDTKWTTNLLHSIASLQIVLYLLNTLHSVGYIWHIF